MCAMQRGVFLIHLSGSGGGNSSTYIKGLPALLEGMGDWCTQLGVANNVISAPILGDVLEYSFQVGLAWHTIDIYHSAISTFLEPHHLHKASNHPATSKLMPHFYLQHPPSQKHFDPWDVDHLLPLLGEFGTIFFSHYL